jgi:hypothetical protein
VVGTAATLSTPQPTWNDTTGYFTFDPASLNYATDPNQGNLGSWSIEAWFNPSADLSTQDLTSIATTTYDDNAGHLYGQINFCLTNYTGVDNNKVNGIYAGFYNGAWHLTPSYLATTPGTWYQVIGTYDGTTLTQYNNGVYGSDAVVGSVSSANGGEIRIARRWDGSESSQYYFPGDIGIIRLYNRALSAGEVAQNFNANKSRFGL